MQDRPDGQILFELGIKESSGADIKRQANEIAKALKAANELAIKMVNISTGSDSETGKFGAGFAKAFLKGFSEGFQGDQKEIENLLKDLRESIVVGVREKVGGPGGEALVQKFNDSLRDGFKSEVQDSLTKSIKGLTTVGAFTEVQTQVRDVINNSFESIEKSVGSLLKSSEKALEQFSDNFTSTWEDIDDITSQPPSGGAGGGTPGGGTPGGGGGGADSAADQAEARWSKFLIIQESVIANSERLRVSQQKLSIDGVEDIEALSGTVGKHNEQLDIANELMESANASQAISIEDLKKLTFARSILQPILDQNISGHRGLQDLQRQGNQEAKADFNERVNLQKELELEISKGTKAVEHFRATYSEYRVTLKDDERAFALALKETNAEFTTQKDHTAQLNTILGKIREKKDKADEIFLGIAHEKDGDAILNILGSVQDISKEYDSHGKSIKELKEDLGNINAQYGMMGQQIQTARKFVSAINREEKEKADQLKVQLHLGHKLAMADAKDLQMQSTFRGELALLAKQDELHGTQNEESMASRTKQWEVMIDRARDLRDLVQLEIDTSDGLFDRRSVEDYNKQIQLTTTYFKEWLRTRQDIQKEQSLDRRIGRVGQAKKDADALKASNEAVRDHQKEMLEESGQDIRALDEEWERLKSTGIETGRAWELAMKRIRKSGQTGGELVSKMAKFYSKDFEELEKRMKEVGAAQDELTRAKNEYAKGMVKAIGGGGWLEKPETSLRKFNKEIVKLERKGIPTIQAIEQAASKTGRYFGSWEKFLSKILINVGAIRTVMSLIGDSVDFIADKSRQAFDLAEGAARLRDAETGFKRLAGAMHTAEGQAVNVNQALIAIRQSAGGAIDEFTLMSAATRGILAGISPKATADAKFGFDDLVTSARALAAVTGREAAESVDRLTNAIAKQERRLLDELGIVVRAEDLYKDYARSHDLVSESMTAEEKVAAFLEGTIERVNIKVAALGGIVDDAQGPFIRLRAEFRNARLNLGEYIRTNDLFQDGLQNVTNVLANFSDWIQTSDSQVASLDERTSDLNAKLKELFKTIGEDETAPVGGGETKVDNLFQLFTSMSNMFDKGIPDKLKFKQAKTEFELLMAQMRHDWPELQAMLSTTGKTPEDFATSLKLWSDQVRKSVGVLEVALMSNTQKARDEVVKRLTGAIVEATDIENKMRIQRRLHEASTDDDKIEAPHDRTFGGLFSAATGVGSVTSGAGVSRLKAQLDLREAEPGGWPGGYGTTLDEFYGTEPGTGRLGRLGREYADEKDKIDALKNSLELHIKTVLGEDLIKSITDEDLMSSLMNAIVGKGTPISGIEHPSQFVQDAKEKLNEAFGEDSLKLLFSGFADDSNNKVLKFAIDELEKTIVDIDEQRWEKNLGTFLKTKMSEGEQDKYKKHLFSLKDFWQDTVDTLKTQTLKEDPIRDVMTSIFGSSIVTGDTPGGETTEEKINAQDTIADMDKHFRDIIGVSGGPGGSGAAGDMSPGDVIANLTYDIFKETAKVKRLSKDLAVALRERHATDKEWQQLTDDELERNTEFILKTAAISFRELDRLKNMGKGETDKAATLERTIKIATDHLGITDQSIESFDKGMRNVQAATKKLSDAKLKDFNRAYKNLLEEEISLSGDTETLEKELSEQVLLVRLEKKHKGNKAILDRIGELQTANENDLAKALEVRESKVNRERESREKKALKKSRDEFKKQQDALKEQLDIDLATLAGVMNIGGVERAKQEITLREKFQLSMAGVNVDLPKHLVTGDRPRLQGGAERLDIDAGTKEAERDILRAQARLSILEKKASKKMGEDQISSERRLHKDRMEEIKKSNKLTMEEKLSASNTELDLHEVLTDELISDLLSRSEITEAQEDRHQQRLTNTLRDGNQDLLDLENDYTDKRKQILSDLGKSLESISGITSLRRLKELRSANKKEIDELISHSEDTKAIRQGSADLEVAIKDQSLRLINKTIRDQQQETLDIQEAGGHKAVQRIRDIGRKGAVSRRDKFSDLADTARALDIDPDVVRSITDAANQQGGIKDKDFQGIEDAANKAKAYNPRRLGAEFARVSKLGPGLGGMYGGTARALGSQDWDKTEEGQNYNTFFERLTVLRENNVANEQKDADAVTDIKEKQVQVISKTLLKSQSALEFTGKAQRDFALEVAIAEKQLSLETLIAKLEDLKEYKKGLKENTDDITSAIASLRKRIKQSAKEMKLEGILAEATLAVNRFGQVANQVAPIIGDIFGKADFAETVSTFVSAAESGTKAIAAFATGNVFGGIMATLQTAGTIYNFMKMKKEEEEQFKRDMVDMWRNASDALRQEAAGTGKAMADAIVDNLDVDMEKLIQNFVKANVAEEIAGVLTEGFKEPLGNLKDAIRAEFVDAENIGELGEEQVGRLNDILEKKLGGDRGIHPNTVKAVIMKTYPELSHMVERDVNVQGETEKKMVRELLPEINAMLGAGEKGGPFGKEISGKSRVFTPGGKSEIELISEAVELHRLSLMKGGGVATMANLAKGGAQMETQMNSVMERLKQAGIIKDDTEAGKVTEGVPTATFRAVTEPQANQMLLVMTQQVNHLYAIETNTSVLPTIARRLDRGSSADPFAQDRMM